MILDLDFMHYRTAIDIIQWCVKNNVDRAKALVLADALHRNPLPQVTWQLEIPDKYVFWLMLKYDLKVCEADERLRD